MPPEPRFDIGCVEEEFRRRKHPVGLLIFLLVNPCLQRPVMAPWLSTGEPNTPKRCTISVSLSVPRSNIAMKLEKQCNDMLAPIRAKKKYRGLIRPRSKMKFHTLINAMAICKFKSSFRSPHLLRKVLIKYQTILADRNTRSISKHSGGNVHRCKFLEE